MGYFKSSLELGTSYERKRLAGEKKVNEFHDGLKILLYMVKSFFKIT